MGGYVSGNIVLESEKILYLYLGLSGYNSSQLSVNKYAFNYGYENYCCNGGGATDVRLVSGNWDSNPSLTSRIMVAGGGGLPED